MTKNLPKEAKFFLDLVKKKPTAFGLECGFEDLTDIHDDWMDLFLNSEGDITLQAHRGSYKTTCLSIVMAKIIVLTPSKNIIFLRKSDDDVKEIVTQTATLLEKPLFQEMSNAIWGKNIKLTRKSVYEIDTNLKIGTRGSPQLLGMGIRSSITGKHGDIVITDDIVTILDRVSRAERERTRLAYQEIQNIKNRGGRIINTGTPWHKDDAFSLMPNIKKYDCYSTGLVSAEELQELRSKMTTSLFSANYELKHIADEEAIFTNPTIDDGRNSELIFDGVCHIDASYGGKDGTAFTILKKRDGVIYVYGELHQSHVDEVLPQIEARREYYRAGTLYTETNADKGYLNKSIKPPKKSYHESMNKFIKISTYLKKEWDNIVFIKETDMNYINEILDYNENAEHDDAPDSLASLIMQSDNKVQMKFFKQGI